MIGKLHLHPRRKRFGFDALELADSTRGAGNDYVDWLHGEVPLDRWAMAHGATPNGWIGRPNHLPEERPTRFGASPGPSSFSGSATPPPRSSSTCRSLTRTRRSRRPRGSSIATTAWNCLSR